MVDSINEISKYYPGGIESYFSEIIDNDNVIGNEFIGIDKPLMSPVEAAEKYYPGGFEAYFHEVLCADKIINK